MQRRRLLFVTDLFPFPLDRGQHVRVKNVLEACGRAFDVTFVGPGPVDGADRGAVEQHCVRSVYLGPLPENWGARTSLALRTARSSPGIPRLATLRRYAPFVAALRGVNPASFDVIWAERPHVARLCAAYRRRTVLDLDDLEHVKIKRLLGLQRAPVDRLRSVYRQMLYRRIEVTWARQFLAAIVCSEEDRDLLARSGCTNGFVVPNAPASVVPSSVSARRSGDRGGPLRVAFLGNVTSEPNLDAIEFFASEILPRLRARDPDATLDVIGPNASPEIRARYATRVHFRGFVPELGAALAEYDVLAAPLRFGSGTKLKVLDAMAHGIPVVTTAVGAEGLSLRHGEHALIAETAAELSDCILRVKDEAALADRLARNAHAHVREAFSWDAIKDRLTEWLLRLEPR
jgi:glycosyltransferase involved in cell wall biosynthesis